jgi:hypothetical protein
LFGECVSGSSPRRFRTSTGRGRSCRIRSSGTEGSALTTLAAWLWWRHAVRPAAAIGALLFSIGFSRWILPGAGVVVLTIAASIARAGRLVLQSAVNLAKEK